MKVKLLKKIRKRYEIEKVTKVSSSTEMWNWWYKDCEKDLGLPFFVLSDNNDSWRASAHRTYEKAYERLRQNIRTDYTHKIKKDETISEVVWHQKHNK